MPNINHHGWVLWRDVYDEASKRGDFFVLSGDSDRLDPSYGQFLLYSNSGTWVEDGIWDGVLELANMYGIPVPVAPYHSKRMAINIEDPVFLKNVLDESRRIGNSLARFSEKSLSEAVEDMLFAAGDSGLMNDQQWKEFKELADLFCYPDSQYLELGNEDCDDENDFDRLRITGMVEMDILDAEFLKKVIAESQARGNLSVCSDRSIQRRLEEFPTRGEYTFYIYENEWDEFLRLAEIYDIQPPPAQEPIDEDGGAKRISKVFRLPSPTTLEAEEDCLGSMDIAGHKVEVGLNIYDAELLGKVVAESERRGNLSLRFHFDDIIEEFEKYRKHLEESEYTSDDYGKSRLWMSDRHLNYFLRLAKMYGFPIPKSPELSGDKDGIPDFSDGTRRIVLVHIDIEEAEFMQKVYDVEEQRGDTSLHKRFEGIRKDVEKLLASDISRDKFDRTLEDHSVLFLIHGWVWEEFIRIAKLHGIPIPLFEGYPPEIVKGGTYVGVRRLRFLSEKEDLEFLQNVLVEAEHRGDLLVTSSFYDKMLKFTTESIEDRYYEMDILDWKHILGLAKMYGISFHPSEFVEEA
ncbi:MAG: hypothetical protein FWG02_10570 [Holophagaceae bacterium]|nr:hypothetical protein [Holophagaceae bacterium]